MTKNLPLLSFLLLSFAGATAQEVTTETTSEGSGYNKWSIELNGGINKATTPFADGFTTERVNLFHGDFGVRYMFNPKFGLKADIGYDRFKNADDTPEFETQYYRADLQGVANLGRIMNFETWTNTLGLLFHTGVGYAQLRSDDGFDGTDNMMNFMAGFTGQIKVSNRIVLNADFSMINNISRTNTFDGTALNPDTRGFDATFYNASVGLTVYLGKNEKHADWFTDEKKDELKALEERVGMIETGLADSDKDGVPDMYDLEPNSIAGVAVNTKGQSIDRNQNGVPDELEGYLDKTYGQNGKGASNGTIEELINGGYVNVYFDFNSTTPTSSSLSGVDFLVKYLKANPSKRAEIVGYADEIGDTNYNKDLSQRRADAVKAIVISAGIDGSRLNVIGNGEDTSVNKDSKEARQIVRRVTFKVN